MEFNKRHGRIKPVTKSDLATAFSYPKPALQWSRANVGAKYRLYETQFTNPTVTAGKEAELYSIKRALEGHTATRASLKRVGLTVENDLDDTEHK